MATSNASSAANIYAHCSYELDDYTQLTVTVDKQNNVTFSLIPGYFPEMALPMEQSYIFWLLRSSWPPEGTCGQMECEAECSESIWICLGDKVESMMLLYRNGWEEMKCVVSQIYKDLETFNDMVKDPDSFIFIRHSTVIEHLLYAFLQMEFEKIQERLCPVKCGYKRYHANTQLQQKVKTAFNGHALTCIECDITKRIAYVKEIKNNLSAKKFHDMLLHSRIGLLYMEDFDSVLNALPIDRIATNKCYYIIAQTLVQKMYTATSPDMLNELGMMSDLCEKFSNDVSI